MVMNKISLTTLPKIKKSSKVRVGRGIGSGKGKTSGRGVKGQKARAGHHSVKGFEGGQTPVHMRLPKRGFVSKAIKCEVVTVSRIILSINSGKINNSEDITKSTLEAASLIKSKNSIVKLILGSKKMMLKNKVLVDVYSKEAKVFSL